MTRLPSSGLLAAPPPIVAPPIAARPKLDGAGLMVGTIRSDVTIQVDFALRAK
jgi:hypothetical protein